MQETVQSLTQKIYQEGIEKAEQQGEQIIAEAREKAVGIVEEAEAKAEEIVSNAEKQAADLKTKMDAELKLSARQAIGKLKQSITDMVIWEVIHDPIEKAFEDGQFIQGLIDKLIEHWLENFGREDNMRILLPQEDYDKFQDYLKSRAQDLLKDGITIEFVENMDKGFQIETQDDSYKVRFTTEDFENYFKSFVRPRTYRLLFGEEQ